MTNDSILGQIYIERYKNSAFFLHIEIFWRGFSKTQKNGENFRCCCGFVLPLRLMRARFFILAALSAGMVCAEVPDSTVGHWGVAVDAAPGIVLKADEYESMWLKDNSAFTAGVEVRYQTLPADGNAFDRDYGYPVLGAGVRYGYYRGVTMHKSPAPDWGPYWTEAGYDSRMGNVLTAYGFFERPLLRKKRWLVDYRLNFGVSYTAHPYSPGNNVDNELIGSRWGIYVGLGMHGTYFFHPQWGIRAGLEFAHNSNGGMNRPNKGSNLLAPMLGVVYREPQNAKAQDALLKHGDAEDVNLKGFKKNLYFTAAVGVGGKVLLEDWLYTQFNAPPEDKDYRTPHFRLRPQYSAQLDMMYRYARRWASGVGADVFYSTGAKRIEELDKYYGYNLRHSPWSVGLAAKHEAFYGNLSLNLSLGFYVFRRMGNTAKWEEKPYYERIGVKYTFPKLHGLFLACNVKAHFTKADYTEVIVGVKI